jgi:uncharacterized protein
MQLHLDRADYEFFLRGADGVSALVNERRLTTSFILSPNTLIEGWSVSHVTSMVPADLDRLFALQPELILLGCGAIQTFPPGVTIAACLSRGIGLETMTNSAAARTFNVLASESRRVVAGFVLQS